MQFNQFSLRECALKDAEKHGAGAVSECKEKYRKRAEVKRRSRRANTLKRDERSRNAN